MLITNINIQDFRVIESLNVTLDGGLVVLGHNGAGKTTLLDAARLLYGRNRHTSRDGKCPVPMTRTGAKEFQVTLDVEAHGEAGQVMVTPSEKSSKIETSYMIPGGEIVEREAFFAWAGVDMRQAELSAALAEALGRNDKDSFGAYLSEYLAGTVTLDVILEHAGGHGEWLRKEAVSVSSSPEMWRAFGKTCYGRRSEVKAQIKALETTVAEREYLTFPLSAKGKPLTLDQTGAVESAVKTITDKIAGFNRELGAALAVTETVDVDALTKQKAALESEYDVIENKAADYDYAKNKYPELKAALDQADAALRAKLDERSALLCLGKTKTCRTCKQKISEAHVEDMVSQIDGATAGLKEAVATAQAALKAHEAVIAERHRAYDRQREKAVVAELAAITEKLKPAAKADSGRAPEAIQEDIDAATLKLAEASKALDTLRQIEQREADKASIAWLTETWEHLDWAVKSFHDGALLNQLMESGKKDELLAAINAELEPFAHTLDIVPDGKLMRVSAGRIGQPMQPYEELSEGQQWLCQYAICLALAAEQEAPILLDGINHLDGKHKQLALARLRKCGATVILAGAWSPSTAPDLAGMAKAFAPAQVLWLDKGNGTVAGAAAA